jgi:hypothetical protein
VRAGHENRAPLRSLSPVFGGRGVEHAAAGELGGHGGGVAYRPPRPVPRL